MSLHHPHKRRMYLVETVARNSLEIRGLEGLLQGQGQ
jgi:hypothetical protein